MSIAPDRCLYCDGTDPECGFCEMGVPLDTQEDWDNSWGRVFKAMGKFHCCQPCMIRDCKSCRGRCRRSDCAKECECGH